MRALVSIGRCPNTEGLGLDKAGLATNQRGQVETDHRFADVGSRHLGDRRRHPRPDARAQGRGRGHSGRRRTSPALTGIVNHDVIPSAGLTPAPRSLGVGLTEEAAKERGEERSASPLMLANSRAKTNHEPDGFAKVTADAKTDRVLGVWVIASVGGTMIAHAAQAMEFGATSEDIAYTCHAHPTHSEAIKEAAMAVLGKPIHI